MKLKYDGNGSSKENAIYFTNAITFNDYIEMEKQYIKQNDLLVKGIKSTGSIKDQYSYDVYQTKNRGNVWFKVPNNLIE